MNRITITIFALLAPIVIWAQGVKIEFFTPSVVHVVKYQGQTVTPESKVVIAKPEDVKLTRKGNTTSSSQLSVKLDEKTGCLTFADAKGKVLLREKKHSFSPLNQTFTLDKGEAIYGLGTIQNGKMNRRGEHKRMEQSNLEDFQNVIQSIKGWGLYWDNYSPTQFDDDANGMSLTSEAGDYIDYYFMYGGSADGVIAKMRFLSGDVPMFPLWTYGFWQSKERYKTAAETGLQIYFTCPYADIRLIKENTSHVIVCAQSLDPLTPGRGMGHVLPESLKEAGADAVFLNHAEKFYIH